MEQFFAYANEGNGKKAYPWLINMQHSVANVMKHVLVAPAVELSLLGGIQPPAKVCPVVEIAGQPCVVMMHMLTGIPSKELGERVADLTDNSASLRDALDFLINGY
ncbi:CcdB family protein [Enterobacter sp. ECC-175]|uniref:CcdB family protein n=1 Tax=unclassified Enterobacter TaxID=2608935 RepID=UPI000D41A805|nr:CcdB family protein [Enterobacter sp. RIT 418]RAU33216.1 taxon MazF [Enterobacter sp. RIT 418]